MKRISLLILTFIVITSTTPAFSQSRTIIVNSSSVERTVITADTTSHNSTNIWEQLEIERTAAEKAEKAEQERIAAEKRAEEERIAAEKAEQERLVAEKKAERERLEAEKKAEQERLIAEKEAQKRIADSIASVKREEELVVRRNRHDSIINDRKERFAAYPWTNIILLNGAYAIYPEYAFGITYARVKQGGYYVSIMVNPSIRFSADYDADSEGAINGITPFYSGQKTTTRWSGTIGGLVRMRIPLYAYAGIGYGYRGIFYETSDYKWVAWRTQNAGFHGMHWEVGLLGNIKGFGISLGISSITDFANIYYEGKLGLGYCF